MDKDFSLYYDNLGVIYIITINLFNREFAGIKKTISEKKLYKSLKKFILVTLVMNFGLLMIMNNKIGFLIELSLKNFKKQIIQIN
jgi:hypothetical protein